jgi:hypothetical protein
MAPFAPRAGAPMSVPNTAIRSTAHDYVLPAAPRLAGDVLVDRDEGVGARTSVPAMRALGDRFLPLAQSQQMLLGELRSHLEALNGTVIDDSRARVHSGVLTALDMLAWCEAAHGDLQHQIDRLARGQAPVDLRDVAERAARGAGLAPGAIRVVGECVRSWWGDAGQVRELVALGLQLVIERTAGQGAIEIEVGDEADGHWIRVAGIGEATDEVDAKTVARFRHVGAALGATVAPDRFGPAAPALRLVLPASDPVPA